MTAKDFHFQFNKEFAMNNLPKTPSFAGRGFAVFLPGITETGAEREGFVVTAESVVCPAVSRPSFGKAVTAAEFNPSQRCVVKPLGLAQAADGHIVATAQKLNDARFKIQLG